MTKRKPNPDRLSDDEFLVRLKDQNAARELSLAERTGGRIAPGPAQAVEKLLVYVKFVLLDLGVLVQADLEWEAQRSEALDRVEAKVDDAEKMSRLAAPTAGPRIIRPGEG